VRVYQLLLNTNPEDSRLKEEYIKTENALRDFHKDLSYYE